MLNINDNFEQKYQLKCVKNYLEVWQILKLKQNLVQNYYLDKTTGIVNIILLHKYLMQKLRIWKHNQ